MQQERNKSAQPSLERKVTEGRRNLAAVPMDRQGLVPRALIHAKHSALTVDVLDKLPIFAPAIKFTQAK